MVSWPSSKKVLYAVIVFEFASSCTCQIERQVHSVKLALPHSSLDPHDGARFEEEATQ